MRLFWLGAGFAWIVAVGAWAEDTLVSIASLVRVGHAREALEEIENLPNRRREQGSLRYLEGRLLLDLGRPCDAMSKLAQTSPSIPEALRDDSMRRWAIAAAQCGHCDQARPILLRAASSSPAVTRHDRAIAADCAVRLGELEVAAEELQRVTRRKRGLSNRVALLALLSDVYVQLGRDEEARDAALDAWISAVRPAEQVTARRLKARAAPSTSERIARAEGMFEARRFTESARELEAIDPGDDTELVARWHHDYGMALFRTRTRYLDAARILYRSAGLGGEYAIEDAFHSARALSRADQDYRAIRSYRRFAHLHPSSKRAPEARFLAAWLEMRHRHPSGEKHMERLVRGKSQVRGRWRLSALWELGFRAFETRRYGRAIRYLSEYRSSATDSMAQARGSYWLGRSYRRGPRAIDAYRKAIAIEPLHWYAILAAHRMKRLGAQPPSPFDGASSPSSGELLTTPVALPHTFEVYRSLGLDVDGIAWLGAHEGELLAPFPKAQRIPMLTRLYRNAGAYREALLTARRRMVYLRSDPDQHRWWWEAAYPTPWLATVDEHRGELPRALIYATMRQESGFRPHVISRAGAIGLMQLMPDIASKLAGEPVTRQMLRVPEINIALGIREMSALAQEFDAVYPLSIAAYNAGKTRVKRWLKESRKMELDRFVERIPFNETRNYVRRVTTHYARYTYLGARQSDWPELPAFVNP